MTQKDESPINIRDLLKEGAQERAERDLQLCKEWFFLEEESLPAKNKEEK